LPPVITGGAQAKVPAKPAPIAGQVPAVESAQCAGAGWLPKNGSVCGMITLIQSAILINQAEALLLPESSLLKLGIVIINSSELMKKINKFLLTSAIFWVLTIFVKAVEFEPPTQNKNLMELLKSVLGWLITIAIPVAVVVFIYGGVLLLFSGGKPERVKLGRQVLTYAAIGLAVILIGRGFYTFILSVINLGK
jgi:hypothetical protein